MTTGISWRMVAAKVSRVSRIGGVNDQLRAKGRTILLGEPAANLSNPRFETLCSTLVQHRECAEHASLTCFYDQIRP